MIVNIFKQSVLYKTRFNFQSNADNPENEKLQYVSLYLYLYIRGY